MDVIVRFLNALLMVFIPLFLGVLLYRRFRLSWRIFFAGAFVFVFSQAAHIPFNQVVLGPFIESQGLNGSDSRWDLLIISLLLGASAGFFEETARSLAYRFWQRGVRSWEGGVMFGAGWGGVESILLGLLAMFGLYQALALRNADLSTILPAGQTVQAAAELANYWGIPWYGALLGALERGFAIIIQISLSLMVLQAFLRGKRLWLLLAFFWHTLVDAFGLFAFGTWGPYVAEALIGLTALIGLAIIFVLRPEADSGKPGDTLQNPTLPPIDLEIDPERLDDSRYIGYGMNGLEKIREGSDLAGRIGFAR